jgi:hypothetical protein
LVRQRTTALSHKHSVNVDALTIGTIEGGSNTMPVTVTDTLLAGYGALPSDGENDLATSIQAHDVGWNLIVIFNVKGLHNRATVAR